MSNDITELRRHLFDTLRGIKDGTIKPEAAKLINETAQVLINTAKVEVDMLATIGGKGTGFIQPPPLMSNPEAAPDKRKALTMAGQLGAK